MTPSTVPIRVWMADGTIHLLRRSGLPAAVAEYPDAIRVERADKPQPRLIDDRVEP